MPHPPEVQAILDQLVELYPLRRDESVAGGAVASFLDSLGLTGACQRVHPRNRWNEKVVTSRRFMRGKRIEIRGGGYFPPNVGDLVQFSVGMARVSHVGGFLDFSELKDFLYDAQSLCRCGEEDFESMACSSKDDFAGGKRFWVQLSLLHSRVCRR